MNATLKTPHLSAAPPSQVVVRAKINGAIVHYAPTMIEAIKWMKRKNAPLGDYRITKSYTAYAAYFDRQAKTWFDPEFRSEARSFDCAIDALTGWCHQAWEWERERHPSPAGRSQAWERWHDVVALLQTASLTTIHNPQFKYRFGQLSPAEGRGHDLRLGVIPTPVTELERNKWTRWT